VLAVQGVPRRVQPVAIARTMPGRAPSANWSLKPGAVVLPSGSVQVWTYAGGASGIWQQVS